MSNLDFTNALSVTAVNYQVRRNLLADASLSEIWIIGEATNVTYHSSGHIYLSLQDADSLIQCTFFSNSNRRFQNVSIKNGEKYYVFGSISTYVKRGSYQFNVTRILPAGKGVLFEKIEELKRKLFSEGLFDSDHKKPLPRLPKNIGLVTALTGAALQDILSTIYKRNPYVNILIATCLVQGDHAARSISRAIQILNQKKNQIDVILVSRGGGSAEDLMAYNEEQLIRTIFQSRIPILSAVGHEIDHSLSDLVADASAKTPTEGAMMVVPDYRVLRERIENCQERQRKLLRACLKNASLRMQIGAKQIFKSHRNFREKIQNAHQELDERQKRHSSTVRELIAQRRLALQHLQIFQKYARQCLQKKEQKNQIFTEALRRLNPQEILKRGYAIVLDKNQEILKRASQTNLKESVDIILHQGSLQATVTELHPSTSGKADSPLPK